MFKVAILGCENSHADAFLADVLKNKLVEDVEFVGVYSDETEAAKKLGETFGLPVADSYDAFVGKVDGIIITARHGDNHYKYAKPYLESGIPLFIDKPITCTQADAVDFMADVKKYNVPVSGGSICVLADYVQELKKAVAEKTYGAVYGGYARAPISLNETYGGFYFYAQHLVQVAMEIFGFYPKSVQTFRKANTFTCLLRYEEYDVPLCFVEGNYVYHAGISCGKGYIGADYDITGDLFKREFMEFYDLLEGKPQKQSYEDFFAPVYVLNALVKSWESGKEEAVNYFVK